MLGVGVGQSTLCMSRQAYKPEVQLNSRKTLGGPKKRFLVHNSWHGDKLFLFYFILFIYFYKPSEQFFFFFFSYIYICLDLLLVQFCLSYIVITLNALSVSFFYHCLSWLELYNGSEPGHFFISWVRLWLI